MLALSGRIAKKQIAKNQMPRFGKMVSNLHLRRFPQRASRRFEMPRNPRADKAQDHVALGLPETA